MDVTREELQKAGASPELARILAERFSRRRTGDLTRNPLVVTAFAALLGFLGWIAIGMTGTQADVAVLTNDVTHLKEGQVRLEERMTNLEDKLDERMDRLEERMTGIENKLDRLLQQ